MSEKGEDVEVNVTTTRARIYNLKHYSVYRVQASMQCILCTKH